MQILHIFHKSQMERIKKELPEVTYVSHVEEKGLHFIKIRAKNEKGGKDEIMFPLQTHPNNLRTEEYDHIIEVIKTKDYAGSQSDVQ